MQNQVSHIFLMVPHVNSALQSPQPLPFFLKKRPDDNKQLESHEISKYWKESYDQAR